MKKTVKEISELCGVSVRTLRYYDQISLLTPSETTDAGYRLYGELELSRLQQILFFRELDFPLKEIKKILDSPGFNLEQTMKDHRSLLTLKRDRLNRLISLVDQLLKGEAQMDFKPFDRSEIDQLQKQYTQEAKERWGCTDAYTEQRAKTANYSTEDWNRINEKMERLYQRLSNYTDRSPGDPEVQSLIAEYQSFISKNFYQCTPEILAGLRELYITDSRFTKHIDRRRPGLAKFLYDAIQAYRKNLE